MEESDHSITRKNSWNSNAWKLIKCVVLGIFIGEMLVLLYYPSDYGRFKIPIPYRTIFSFGMSFLKKPTPWIDSSPIYSKFNISTPMFRKRVTVLIIVSTAPRRFDRRQAIRETWWKDCKQINDQVIPECIFMTDYQEPSSQYYNSLQNESATYGDIRFQYLNGGADFGFRYLYHAIYAMKHYNFDYFLRMDDDFLFCVNNFLQELPRPMERLFHWGWVHCIESITRPEESMILMSRDLITNFLKQDPEKMKCHLLADQMIAEWTNDLNLTGKIFRHDDRIHHTPIVSQVPSLMSTSDICSKFMAIHGCYPTDLRLLWKRKGPYTKSLHNLKENSKLCTRESRFNWKLFSKLWRYEPKRCRENPSWDTSKLSLTGGSYTGRQNS